MNKTLIPLFSFFFIFILIFSNNVLGYEIFTANPYFETNASGVVLYGETYNSTMSWYNSTNCNTWTWNTQNYGCLLIENNGTSQQQRIWLQKYDWNWTGLDPHWTSLSGLLLFNDTQNGIHYLETYLPSNQEGIFVFTYRWNNTLTTPAPFLTITDQDDNEILNINLNATPNVWHETQQIINPSISYRNLIIRMVWTWDNLPTSLLIDNFKFYTYDTYEAYTPVDYSTDLYHFCGDKAAGPINYYYTHEWACGEVTTPGAGWQYNFNSTRNNGILYGHGEDCNWCMVFKIGDAWIGRRVVQMEKWSDGGSCAGDWRCLCYGWKANLYKLRDAYFIQENEQVSTATPCDDNDQGTRYLIEGISLLNAKITVFRNKLSTDGVVISGSYLQTNSTPPSAYWFANVSGHNAFTNLTISNLTEFNHVTVSLITDSFSNTSTPAGTGWRLGQTSYMSNITNWIASYSKTAYYPFFANSQFGTCTSHSECSPSSNNQTYINSDCSQSTPVYCSLCGCDSNSEYCNFPTVVGSYCDTNDPSNKAYITSYENCTYIYGQCGTNQGCNQYTLTLGNTSTSLYTISCYNTQTAQHDFCIDENGNNVSCSSINQRIINYYYNNATEGLEEGQISISSLACAFGVASGLGGCEGGKFMIGFLLVVLIIGSINGFDYIATKDHKFLPKELNILFLVMLLIGFTFAIPLLNPLIIVSILIVSTVLLTSRIKEHLTGKGGGGE